MAMPRMVSVTDVRGKRRYAIMFDEPISESQRQYFEYEDWRVTRFARGGMETWWGIDTMESRATWQFYALAILLPWFVLAVMSLL